MFYDAASLFYEGLHSIFVFKVETGKSKCTVQFKGTALCTFYTHCQAKQYLCNANKQMRWEAEGTSTSH